ncbi:MAG: N-acetylmuramoyl-L-alanine amidase [Alphaproteobacteria bacterium]|nr:N-acetylmuramoyl-L-alanine amidase [Alphaproteobacteria bacterium]
MKKTWSFVWLVLGFFLWITPVFAAQIKNIRLAKYQPQVIRLVVETDEKADTKIFTLSSPDRLVIDFKNTYFSKSAPSKISSVDFIKSIRRGVPDKQTARLVLELPHKNITENHFNLKPSNKSGWRFVVDIKQEQNNPPQKEKEKEMEKEKEKENNNTSQKKSPATVPPQKPTTQIIPTPNTQTKEAAKPKTQEKQTVILNKKTKKIVVLDPGHGGKDPGAISRSGQYEKHITLAMAKETRRYLEEAGYKVVLTRSTDKAIPLRRRYQIAHEADGDLFISIHADSAKNRSARGLSVYTISERASDKEAAALAERENKADILLGLDLSEYNPDVSNILIDLAKIDTMNKSAIYAKYLVKEMKKETTLLPNAHRFAGFAVLKSANIPSVLLELGYLSNPREDKLLQKKSYRRKLARALVRAIDQYFEEQNN